MPRYRGDPMEISVKTPRKCKECGADIKTGERAAYWPATNTCLCWKCGEGDLLESLAAMADEDGGY